MKKTITIIASLLVAVGMTAQINPLQVASHLNKAEIKIIRSGNEVLGNLLVNPNPHTSSVLNSKSTITEEMIGTTTYDLQSNAAVQNRIIVHDDGTISAAWTMSQEYNSVWPDRGTGYNFFDGTDWGAPPTDRLEASRGGWPSMIAMGSGKEASITHNTDNGYVNMTHRATTGYGAWSESIISSQDSNGVYRDMIWNRTVVGGINNESLHMVAVTASSNFGGAPFNGLDGALVYYRSQDEGVTWDRKDIQLPGLDTAYYTSHSGDSYALAAKGNTIALAYFASFADAILIKSTDNGDTWTKTIFSNFPVDAYIPDTGLDMDADGFADTVYTTDGSGALLLDDNGMAHIFYGNMRVTDGDLTDGFTSYFPGTNGLIYWNESLGEDTSGVWVTPSLWDHGNGIVIAGAEDTDGDGTLNLIDWGGYGGGISSMPHAGIDANGVIFVSYSAVMENIDNGSQNFRHINIIKSIDGGATWSNSVDVTPHTIWAGAQECVFGSMNPIVDDKIRIVYQKDFEPGTTLGPDEDMVDNNEIIYLEIDTVGLFDTPVISTITELNNSTYFSVYPNPVKNTLTIDGDYTSATIYDLFGKLVLTTDYQNTIDVSALSNGIYFIKVDNTIIKFIKQ